MEGFEPVFKAGVVFFGPQNGNEFEGFSHWWVMDPRGPGGGVPEVGG